MKRCSIGLAMLALGWAACGSPASLHVRYTAPEADAADTADSAESVDSGSALAREPRKPEDVSIFALGPPSRAHDQRGVVAVRVHSSEDVDRRRMLAALRTRAAALGCDALVLFGPAYEDVTREPLYRRRVTESQPVYRARCIVYRQEGQQE